MLQYFNQHKNESLGLFHGHLICSRSNLGIFSVTASVSRAWRSCVASLEEEARLVSRYRVGWVTLNGGDARLTLHTLTTR